MILSICLYLSSPPSSAVLTSFNCTILYESIVSKTKNHEPWIRGGTLPPKHYKKKKLSKDVWNPTKNSLTFAQNIGSITKYGSDKMQNAITLSQPNYRFRCFVVEVWLLLGCDKKFQTPILKCSDSLWDVLKFVNNSQSSNYEVQS